MAQIFTYRFYLSDEPMFSNLSPLGRSWRRTVSQATDSSPILYPTKNIKNTLLICFYMVYMVFNGDMNGIKAMESK